MFELNFADLLDPNHELMRAANLIEWDELHEALRFYYSTLGRQGKPIRLMVGLQLLKHNYNCSDERVVEQLHGSQTRFMPGGTNRPDAILTSWYRSASKS